MASQGIVIYRIVESGEKFEVPDDEAVKKQLSAGEMFTMTPPADVTNYAGLRNYFKATQNADYRIRRRYKLRWGQDVVYCWLDVTDEMPLAFGAGGEQEDIIIRVEKAAIPGPVAEVLHCLRPFMEEVTRSLSATRSASGIPVENFRTLLASLRIKRPIQEDDGGPSFADLLAAAESGESTMFWDETSEPKQRAKYASQLQGWCDVTPNFEWFDAKSIVVRYHFEGHRFPISGDNDEVLIRSRFKTEPQQGAVLGVEMKKRLSWRGYRQAVCELLLWGASSLFPFVQVITDMEFGGLAFYYNDGAIRYRVLMGINAVVQFVRDLVGNLPPDLGGDSSSGGIAHFEELTEPPRKKFRAAEASTSEPAPTPHDSTHNASSATFWRRLARIYNNMDDIANLEELGYVRDEQLRTYFDDPTYVELEEDCQLAVGDNEKSEVHGQVQELTWHEDKVGM